MAKMISTETLRDLAKEYETVETIEFNKIEIEVKQYLPIEQKRILIELVLQSAFIADERGFKKFDAVFSEAMMDYFIVRNYTNLSLMEDPFEMYDTVKSTGLLRKIKESIPLDEILQIKNFLEDRIKEEFRLQELNTAVGHKIEDMIGLISRKTSEALEAITKFDPKALSTLTSFLNEEQLSNLDNSTVEEKTEQ